MCGIAGAVWINPDKRISSDVLERMTEVIRHRGPDDQGFFARSYAETLIQNESSMGIALGFRRLSIIDLESGHQPIANQDGTIWVVNNGEIYNFRQLRRELRRRGYTFRTESDTEVIVHLYEEFGESFLEHLEGMFGMALWD